MQPEFPAAAALPWQQCVALLERLPTLEPEERTGAVEALIRNPSPWIRQRALRAGAAVLEDAQIVAYLRDESDDILRNMGLEILKMKGAAALPLALRLLGDEDPDVVLQAVLALDAMRDIRALEPLRQTLAHPDPNVAQAAILALGQVGDERVIPDILKFLKADPWLQMAAVQCLGDLRSAKALAPLQKLLPDLFLGSMAAEAIARIGGSRAFTILTGHWLSFAEALDPETMVGLLAHVAEGLGGGARGRGVGVAATLVPYLEDVRENLRMSAARCLVTMGPGRWDARALEVLATRPLPHPAPSLGMEHRKDLVPGLLSGEEPYRTWGLHLLTRFPDAAPPEVVELALGEAPLPEQADLVLRVLSRLQGPAVGRMVLAAYGRFPVGDRGPLIPLLLKHRSSIQGQCIASGGLDPVTRTVVLALLGDSPDAMAEAVLSFTPEDRLAAIAQLVEIKPFLKKIPWGAWLEEAPETYCGLACDVAVRGRFEELHPLLRTRLDRCPTPALIETMGLLGDRQSVPILKDLLDAGEPFLKALVLDALGSIGGPDARDILRGKTKVPSAKEAALAYGALARCAIEEDVPLFRGAVNHPEWMARLAGAEVLGRYPSPENIALLALLAADPSAAVARRAAALLDG